MDLKHLNQKLTELSEELNSLDSKMLKNDTSNLRIRKKKRFLEIEKINLISKIMGRDTDNISTQGEN